MIAPATTRVTLGYGVYGEAGYTQDNPHAGVDFSHDPDPYIYAPEDGEVVYAGWMGTAGNATEILAGSHRHRLCHQSEFYAGLGERVQKGQRIGRMGDTGNAFGVHLHWVMWNDGVRVNGLDYVNEGEDMGRIEDLEASEQRLAAEVVARDKRIEQLVARVTQLETSEQHLAQEVVARDKKIAALESEQGEFIKVSDLFIKK